MKKSMLCSGFIGTYWQSCTGSHAEVTSITTDSMEIGHAGIASTLGSSALPAMRTRDGAPWELWLIVGLVRGNNMPYLS